MFPMAANVHPELIEQLANAGESPVQAVLQLRAAHDQQQIPSPEESAKLADDVLRRVQNEVGRPPIRTNLLRNISSLIVEADPEFLGSLLKQPEVVYAQPNQRRESLFIPPKGKRPA